MDFASIVKKETPVKQEKEIIIEDNNNVIVDTKPTSFEYNLKFCNNFSKNPLLLLELIIWIVFQL